MAIKQTTSKFAKIVTDLFGEMLTKLALQHFVDDQWAMFPPVITEFARVTMQNFNELSSWLTSDQNYLKTNYQTIKDAQQIVQNTDRFLSAGREDLASFKEQIDRRVRTLETDVEFKLASLQERQRQTEEQIKQIKVGIEQQIGLISNSILESIRPKFGEIQKQLEETSAGGVPGMATDKIASLEKRYADLLADLFTRSDGFAAKFDTLYKDYVQSTAAFSELTEAFKLDLASQTSIIRKCEADFLEVSQKMDVERARIPALANQIEALTERVVTAEEKYPVLEALELGMKTLETIMIQQDSEDKSLGNSYKQLCVKYDSMKLFLETEARSLRDEMGDCEDATLHSCEEMRAAVAQLADSVQDLEEDLLFQINNCKSLLVGTNVYKEYEVFRQKSYDELVVDSQRNATFAFLSPLEMRLHRIENLLIDHMAQPGHGREKPP